MKFSYGLNYLGVRYGWKDKELYRLPFERNNKTFGLKFIKPVFIGSTKCYNLQRNKITINRLKILTEKVDWDLEIVKDKDCPF